MAVFAFRMTSLAISHTFTSTRSIASTLNNIYNKVKTDLKMQYINHAFGPQRIPLVTQQISVAHIEHLTQSQPHFFIKTT